jgi:hypothetical protein
MVDDSLRERGRSLEEEYFRKKNQELIDKMRRAADAEAARKDLSAKTGLQDPALLHEIEALGFTADTVSLLPIVPVLQVAWAEGGVSEEERTLVLQLARARGIAEGSAADRQLSGWLARRPDPQVFERAGRLLRAMLAAGGQAEGALTADDLVKYCEDVAAASGGIFGMRKISAEERQLLSKIAADLKHH